MTTGELGGSSRIEQLSDVKRALLAERLRARQAARTGTGSAASAGTAASAPRQADQPVLLSFAQERLWLLAEMTPGLAAYNTTRVVRVTGSIDVARLRAALRATIARHEVLRTRVSRVDGRPVARLAPVGDAALDLVHSTDESAALAAVDDFAARPFALERDDLIRGLLVTVSNDQAILALTLHHIASDEASRAVLWDDLSAAYATEQLNALPRQYSDFARSQRAKSEQPAMAGEIDWWRARLAGAPRVIDLPIDHRRPAVQNYQGARHRVPLDPELVAALRAYGASRGATLFVTVLAGLVWMLGKWGRTEDVVVGMPVSGRDVPEAEGLIGLFVNTVVVRSDCSGAPSFGELVDRVRVGVLSALEHQNVPFEKVVEAVASERDVSRNPIFQVLVNAVTSEHRSEFALGDLSAEVIDFDPHTTKFDLGILVSERPGVGVDLVFEYATDLFDPRTVADLAAEVATLLRSASTAPQLPMAELGTLPADQLRRLVYDANATGAPVRERCLHELIAEQARRTPGRPAVADESTALTYRELDETTNALAHRLVALGVGPNVPVAVAVQRSVAMEIAVLAVLKAGGAYVPLDSSYPIERLAYMLDDCAAPVLITESAMRSTLPEHPVTVIVDDPAVEAGRAAAPPDTAVTPDDLAYIIYTSGSTGRPKGVELRHRGVVNRLDWMQRTFALTDGDTVLQKTPLSFDVSVWEVLWPLMTGARLFMARPSGHRDVSYLLDVIARERITVLHFVPSMLGPFLGGLDSTAPGAGRCLRTVICSGEALPVEVKDQFFDVLPGAELHNLYGPTEASIDVTWSQCLPGLAHRVLIGAPITNVGVYVVDEHRRPVAVGVPGELYLAGVQLARGYLGREDLTAERFVDFELAPAGRAYRTGDLVRWTSGGELDYLGRIDDQVKLRGFRIELGEIEAVFAAHPAVARSSVVVANGPSGEPMLAAYVVLRQDAITASDESPAQLTEWSSIWEQTYAEPLGVDPEFDTRGWTSSFTGKPIPESEMAEWVQTTVDRIAALGGRSVLEIGAGSGLLMWRLAPSVDHYVATDFSAAAVTRLQRLLSERQSSGPQLSSVTAYQLAADEVDANRCGRDFDTIVANSVVQYFPDAEYLTNVLTQAIGMLAPGGRVFVGDVRDLRLHGAFAVRVEQANHAATTPAELRLLVEDRCALDGELLVDPRYFAGLPGVGHLQVLPERGMARTEMSCFRYDVVLHGSGVHARELDNWTTWAQVGGFDALERLLTGAAEFGVLAIPNARVAADLGALDALVDGQLVPTPGIGIEPELLWELAERHGYHLELSVLSAGGAIDAAFTRDGVPVRFPAPPAAGSSLTNDPALARNRALVRAKTSTQLAAAARERLPEYMVPAAIRVLERLPLTPNGKLDRASLPQPTELRDDASSYVAPRTETERRVAALWTEILGAADIGVDDDFFRLGGHSLLAVRLLAALERTQQVTVPLRTMFETPTIAALSAEIDRQREIGEKTSLERVDRSGHRALRAELSSRAQLEAAMTGAAQPGAADVSVFPLSSAQERMWFLDEFESGEPRYTVRRAYRVAGAVDAGALQQALDLLAARHDSLRTVVLARDGLLAAIVADHGRWPLHVVDLSAESDPERVARKRIDDEATQAFDLVHGPLAAASLYLLGGDDALLILRLHHIIVDGWSMDVLVSELAECYEAIHAGRPNRLPDPPLPYPDFAIWQRRVVDESRLAGQLDYWRDQLAGAPPVLELPSDHVRPQTPTGAGHRRSTDLGELLTESVRNTARTLGTTPFVVLLAACSALLARLTGHDDIVVGTAVAGRQRHEVERSVGLFANTLVLRTDLSDNPRFADVVRRCRSTVIDAQTNQDVPFDRLVEELHPERDIGRNPLFQIMINMQPAAQSGLLLDDAALTPYDVDAAFARFDLSFAFAERDGNLQALVEYRADRYDDGTAEMLLERLRMLLSDACAEPGIRVADLPVLSPAEQEQLLRQGTNDGVRPGVTALELIRRSVARVPDQVAVIGPDGVGLSYADLWRQSGRLARRIAAAVPAGALVGVAVERHAGLVVAALAAWRAGCAYVPLDPSYPADRLDFMVSDSAAALVLGDADVADLGVDVGVADADCADADSACAGRSALDDRAEPGVDDLAYVIYTSGSTGRPKGVAVEHGALANLLVSMAERPGLRPADRLLAVTTFSFDIAALELFLPLTCGASVVIADREVASDPLLLASALTETGASIVQATPSTFRMLVESGWPGDPRLRVLCGGEALTADLAGRLQPIVAELWNCYGPTETTIWSTVDRVLDRDDVTVGTPIANTVAYVLDRHRRLVAPGAQGELWLGGAGLARGYLNRPELTAERFANDPWRAGARIYRTGDLAAWTRDGRLRCLGRTDHQIKLRGHRIELGEIEAAIEAAPAVGEAVVVLREDQPGDPRIVGYVVGSAEGVLERLRARLPAYMIPSAVVELDAIPRTLNGKTDRAALPRPRYDHATGTAPTTPAEQVVAAIWADLLGIDAPCLEDDFFALGGHSLLATRLSARLSGAFGATVALRAVFENPTLGALAAAVSIAAASTAASPGDRGPAAVSRAGRGIEASQLGDRSALLAALEGRSQSSGSLVVFPMSATQRRMWLLYQLAPLDARYHVPVLRTLTGPLDTARLRVALAALVARHEILRTTYLQHDDLLVQVVRPGADPNLIVHELPGATLEDAKALARTDLAEPFDLTQGPALRASVSHLDDGTSLLMLCAHHIAMDGWSIDHLLAELATCYAGGTLAPLSVQFGDYAIWELGREDDRDDRDYWRRQLAGAPSEVTLPLSRPRTVDADPRGRRIRRRIDAELAQGISDLAESCRATPFMVLCAALSAFLSRHNAGDDIVLGTPLATRSFAGSESMIGVLINTLALRFPVDGRASFRAHVDKVSVICAEAYRHGEYPFDKLVAELDIDRDPSRHPLFQILVAMQDARPNSVAFGAAELIPTEIDWQVARYDAAFSFSGTSTGDRLEFVMEYRADLIDEKIADWLVVRFEQLLRACVERADGALRELPVLAGGELVDLEAWEGHDEPAPAELLPALIAKVAAEFPLRPAVEVGGDVIGFADLLTRAASVGNALSGHGVQPGDLVAIALGHSIDWIVAVLAVWHTGAAFVPVDPGYPRARQLFMLEDSGCSIVLTSAAAAADFTGTGTRVLVVDEIRERPSRPVVLGAASPAYLIYTSGSTGTPKGTLVNHGALAGLADAIERIVHDGEPIGAELRVSVNAPVSFDASMQQVVHLARGATLLPIPDAVRMDPPLFVDYLHEHRVDVLDATPTHLRTLLGAGLLERAGGPSVLLIGGEAIDTELWSTLRRSGRRVWNVYGPTEVTVDAVAALVAGSATPVIGRPLPGVLARVVDQLGQRVPVGVSGELWLSGRQVSVGYLGRADLTAQRFRDRDGRRWFCTGDIVRYGADGQLEYLGRSDDQVKIRGHRVELEEVAAGLRSVAGIRAAAALARDGELIGYVVPEPAVAWDPVSVRHELRATLPSFLVPAVLVPVVELPLLPSGKLDQSALAVIDAMTERTVLPPTGPAEELIAELWASLLGVAEVGTEDDFFDLGGDSLSASRFIAQLGAMDIDLPLMSVFTHPTVRELGETLTTVLLNQLADNADNDQ